MARRWNKKEEKKYGAELYELYVVKNLSIAEIGLFLGISEKTVFQRLERLGIKTRPEGKRNYLNKRKDIFIPRKYTADLAEFFGIMLGDGKLSHFQIAVTLGSKEESYALYVVGLMEKNFKVRPKISIRKNGYQTVYFGSVELSGWLKREGLVYNKAKSQVDVPKWIFNNKDFMKRFIRGFFDTDGSVYKLKFGNQISFTNRSIPILKSLRKILIELEYKPSIISVFKVYLTKIEDLRKFFNDVEPKNKRHIDRWRSFGGMRLEN